VGQGESEVLAAAAEASHPGGHAEYAAHRGLLKDILGRGNLGGGLGIVTTHWLGLNWLRWLLSLHGHLLRRAPSDDGHHQTTGGG
jgi:hypothetical protein